MTNEEFDAFAEEVRSKIGSLPKQPKAFAIMILPDERPAGQECQLMAAFGSKDGAEGPRRELIEGLFILAEQLDEAYPEGPKN